MKTIPLTNSEQVAIVDDLFYNELLALGPWRLGAGGYVVMAMDARLGTCQMHRVILGFAGPDAEFAVLNFPS